MEKRVGHGSDFERIEGRIRAVSDFESRLVLIREKGYDYNNPKVMEVLTGGRHMWMDFKYERYGSKSHAENVPYYLRRAYEYNERLFATALKFGKLAENVETGFGGGPDEGNILRFMGINDPQTVVALYEQSAKILHEMLWGCRIYIDTTMGQLLVAAKYAERGGDEESATVWVKIALSRIEEILTEDEKAIRRAD